MNLNIVSTLCSLPPVTEQEVIDIIAHSTPKSAVLDPAPTWLIKKCTSATAPLITEIINCSFASCVVPPALKHAIITPALKKPHLNREDMASYRPISNLPYVSKVLERVVASRLA
jgi:hypothetical protein